jgi:putative NADH-flavin reductase
VILIATAGNIGVSVIIAALRRGMNVLALVRDKTTAKERILKYLDYGETLPTDNIIYVETDVVKDGGEGVQGVVEKVKKGELPEFQHVYSTGIATSFILGYHANQGSRLVLPKPPSYPGSQHG